MQAAPQRSFVVCLPACCRLLDGARSPVLSGMVCGCGQPSLVARDPLPRCGKVQPPASLRLEGPGPSFWPARWKLLLSQRWVTVRGSAPTLQAHCEKLAVGRFEVGEQCKDPKDSRGNVPLRRGGHRSADLPQQESAGREESATGLPHLERPAAAPAQPLFAEGGGPLLGRVAQLASVRSKPRGLPSQWREVIQRAGSAAEGGCTGGALALRILEEMSRTRGQAKVRANAHHIVAALQVCRSVKEGEAILAWSRQQGTVLNAHVFSALIKLYLLQRATDKARALYQVIHDEGIAVDVVLYNALLEAENDVGHMWRILADMDTAGVRPDDRTYAACLRCAGSVADAESVGELEDRLLGSRLRVSLHTFNALIDAWANCGEVACGWQAVEALREAGLRPDWWTFNTLIKMHALQGDKEGAFRAFHAMQAEGVPPDRVTYNTLLESCVQARSYEAALSFYRQWRKKGQIEPDSITLAILLRAAGHRLDVGKVQKVLAEGKAAGVRMDEKVYESAVLAFVRCGEGAPALGMLEEMTAAGYPPAMEASQVLTKCVESALVRECKAAAPAGRLRQFLHDMAAAGVLPTADTGAAIVKSLALTKGPQAAMDVAWELQRGHVKPLGAATWQVVKAAIRNAAPPLYKQAAAAARLLPDAIVEDGLAVNSDTYEVCITACARAGDGVAALALFEDLRGHGLETRLTIEKVWLDTVGAAIQGAISEGAAGTSGQGGSWAGTGEQAAPQYGGPAIARELAASGIRLTAGGMPSLISAVAAASDSDSDRAEQPRESDGAGLHRAMLLLDVLPKLFDLPPSPSGFGALMKACLAQKQALRAEEVWQRMRLAQVAPDLAAWRLRVQALAAEQQLAGRVSAFLSSMQKDGVDPDEDTLSIMLRACQAAGDTNGARYMLNVMEAFQRQQAVKAGWAGRRRALVAQELPTVKARRVAIRRSTLRDPEPPIDLLKERDRRRKRFTSRKSPPTKEDSAKASTLVMPAVEQAVT